MKKQRLTGLLCALLATLCWASNYPVSRLVFNCAGAGGLDEWWSSWIRNFLCAVCLLPFTFFCREKGWGQFFAGWKKDWRLFCFLGVALVGESALCFAAAKYTTAARTSLFANTSPVFTLLISFLAARELLNARKITGVFMGLAGVIIAAGSRGTDAFTADLSTLGGDLLALCSGIFWALFTVFGGDASKRYNGMFCTVIYRICGLAFLSPFLLFCNVSFNIPLKAFLGILYMAVVSGGVAVWLWSYAQKHVEPGVLGSFGYLSAFCAAGSSMIFLGEKITFSFAAAFVLILGGLFLILKPGRPGERNFSLHSLKQLRK